jgi:hypothetical protein
MALVGATVEVFFNLSSVGGDYLTLDDAVKGELDAGFQLAGDVSTDITDRAYAVSIQRGRSRELDQIESGVCEVRLRNYDGAFVPAPFVAVSESLKTEADEILLTEDSQPLTVETTSSLGSDNIVPGKRVRISVEGVVIFDGLIDDWEYEYLPAEVDASFIAVDGFGELARRDLSTFTGVAGDTAGERISFVLDKAEIAFTANRAIDAGVSTFQADVVADQSNALDYIQTCARTDLGRVFMSRTGVFTFRDRHALIGSSVSASFADDGSGISYSRIDPAYGRELLFNRVSVLRDGGTAQVSNRTDSQDAYGIRSLPISGVLLEDDDQAQDMADYLAGIYSEPQARAAALSVVVDGLTSAERAALMSLDLGDVVTVLWTPQGLAEPVGQVSVVEGLSDQITFDGGHVRELRLSPVTQSAALILDDPISGVLDSGVLAF